MCVKLVVFGGHTVILLGIHSTLRSVLARDECSTIRALHPNTPGVGSSDQVGRPIPNWTGFLSAQKPYFFPFLFSRGLSQFRMPSPKSLCAVYAKYELAYPDFG